MMIMSTVFDMYRGGYRTWIIGRHFFDECFNLPDRSRTLYQIRNSIDHGDIDASSTGEIHKVEARLNVLWRIVWGMFGQLIPYGAPAGKPESAEAKREQ
jgi:hypothetical protein